MRKRVNTPRFNLKDNKQKSTLIYLIYNYSKGKRLKYSTGKKINPKYWDKNKGLARESLEFIEGRELNIFLRELQNETLNLVKQFPNANISEIKAKLDHFSGIVVKEHTKATIVDFAKEQIKKSNLEQRTIDKMIGTCNHLMNYSKHRNVTLTFDKLSIDWKEDFVEYLYSETAINSPNSINKVLETIKRFMKIAFEKKIYVNGEFVRLSENTNYSKKEFNVKRVKSSKHFLEIKHLKILKKLDLAHRPSYDIVLDYFLLMCYTGLRWSDVTRLNKNHFIEDEGNLFINLLTFKGRTNKPDTEVAIPVLKEVVSIMKKYDWMLPKHLSEQKHREYIKKICSEANLNDTVLHKEYVRGKAVERHVPIYSKINNHTGRYTFINMMINDFGVSPIQMTKITGQSLKVLLNYERGNKMKNAKNVQKIIDSRRIR